MIGDETKVMVVKRQSRVPLAENKAKKMNSKRSELRHGFSTRLNALFRGTLGRRGIIRAIMGRDCLGVWVVLGDGN
ncbi:unnamed protein product [Fusarium graminearum]|uniref:Uncharacterized protein n=1 Tax=Gibberella zeae TaxID=5518 RepID=A0A9N8RGR2_GIBZA|nr:unnamed protein product [Fusarium graminearum]